MKQFTFLAANLDQTDRLGAALARQLPDRTTVALCGTLGAGKTRLVQAVARGCGVPDGEVVSPTFTLCREHRARRTLYHLDVYRLRDEDEFLDLGPEEMFEADAITFIEWADRVIDCLPADRIEITIEPAGPTARHFTLRATAPHLRPALEAIAAELAES